MAYDVEDERMLGGAGCRAMNAGMRSARRIIVNGRTDRRYGSKHMKVYIASRERVCVGLRHERRRMRRAWKTKTTPIRALKRRKLVDMVGREKEGRVGVFGEALDG